MPWAIFETSIARPLNSQRLCGACCRRQGNLCPRRLPGLLNSICLRFSFAADCQCRLVSVSRILLAALPAIPNWERRGRLITSCGDRGRWLGNLARTIAIQTLHWRMPDVEQDVSFLPQHHPLAHLHKRSGVSRRQHWLHHSDLSSSLIPYRKKDARESCNFGPASALWCRDFCFHYFAREKTTESGFAKNHIKLRQELAT